MSVRGPGFDHATGVEDGDAIGDRRENPQVVRDEDDRQARLVPKAVEQPDDPGLNRHVERRRGLVGDQELRPTGERDRDGDPLSHPTGELVRERVERALRIRDPYLAQGLDGQLGGCSPSEAEMQAHVVGELRPDGQHRVQGSHRVLEDHRELTAADPAQLARR